MGKHFPVEKEHDHGCGYSQFLPFFGELFGEVGHEEADDSGEDDGEMPSLLLVALVCLVEQFQLGGRVSGF